MQKYLLVYFGGHKFETKEQGMAHMGKWQAWMQGLGDAVIDPGMPVMGAKTVSSKGATDGGVTPVLSGITILQAETMDDAVSMAAKCPHIEIGGSIEVAQAMDMEM